MSPYSLPGFSHRLPCRGPDPPAPPGPTPLVIGGQAGRGPPLTPPTGGTPLYSCFPDFGLANHGAVSGERPVAVPSSLFASRFSIFSPHRRSAIARGLEVFHPALPRCLHHQFLPSLYADKWLSAIPLAHCLRELTGEIRCLPWWRFSRFRATCGLLGASRFCLTPVSALFQSRTVHARCLSRSATSSGSHLT